MNTNAVYVIGNGTMAAACQNGDLMQVFGPPYSAPPLLTSRFVSERPLEAGVPQHMPGAAVWQVQIMDGEKSVAQVTDFAVADAPCLVRRICSSEKLTMRLLPMGEDDTMFRRPVPSDGRSFDFQTLTKTDDGVRILMKAKSGNAVYFEYPIPHPQYYTLLIRGDATVTGGENFAYDIAIDGTAELLIIGGPDYPNCDMTADRLAKCSYEQLLADTLAWWQGIMANVPAFQMIPQEFPMRQQALQAIEDTVLNIVTQQSSDGGVLAGYAYHMAYVRDQFGVCMAMLKLGMKDRAEKMLRFYAEVFRRSGKICNAQAMGIPHVFHHAENDAVEITGYLLLQFFRYAQVTGDEKLLKENVDFLKWLYRRQESQLQCGTLPFNGDETYIAGGLVPRDVLNDGSAEATMLFLISGKELLAFLRKNRLAGEDTLLQMQLQLAQVEAEYPSHFVVDGEYVLNDPRRADEAKLPDYRFGVCMNLGAEGCQYLTWTKRSPEGTYLCPNCLRLHNRPARKRGIYPIPSALLMPAYLGFAIPGDNSTLGYLKKLTDALQRDGYVYSNETAQMNVGYDYGLLLYNLVHYNLPGGEMVCRKMLSQLDECGAWAEYYHCDRPVGTRYRAWESGINIDALLCFAQAYKAMKSKE